jgi:A/G-specific adenine glycosylase
MVTMQPTRWTVQAPEGVPTDRLFFDQLVVWQRQHGRHGLPWQGTRDPYRVWLSEVMLQQTQVSTVLGYYPQFLARFPDVQALAAAPVDEVLALWSGLGYYSRARNLHRCAQAVVAQGGVFPQSAQALQALPGIGPSTAAAIAAFCFGERVSILDGNVKRVLARLLGFSGDMADARQVQALWGLAQGLVPGDATPDAMAAYTQGLMDLGAGLCARRRPQCLLCPAQAMCVAHREGLTDTLPMKSRRVARRSEHWWLLVWRRSDGAVWLEQRPSQGIWSGLHAFPVHSSLEALEAAVCADGVTGLATTHPTVKHDLTHRELFLHLVEQLWPSGANPTGSGLWLAPGAALDLGLPAPIKVWLTADRSRPAPGGGVAPASGR